MYASITGMWSLSTLLGVKTVHLLNRANLIKISNLVDGGREIVTSLYGSLQGQTVCSRYSELAGSPFVSVKIKSQEKFLEQLTL
jgi:hypothetical protein